MEERKRVSVDDWIAQPQHLRQCGQHDWTFSELGVTVQIASTTFPP